MFSKEMLVKHRIVGIAVLLFVVSAFCVLWREFSGEFSSAKQRQDACPASFFSQTARVFDAVTICATKFVSPAKLAHAAAVTAQWLDNDADGIVDEPRLLPILRENNALLVMSETGFPLFQSLRVTGQGAISQELHGNETAPGAGAHDSSQQKIYHLIFNAGWANRLPDLFADQPGSALYDAWEKAEANGYFHDDGLTCTAACTMPEFFSHATAAYLGSNTDPQAGETRLKSRQALTEALPEVVALMENDRYHYPTHAWPDGNYPHAQNIVFDGPVDFAALAALDGHKITFAAPGEGDNQDIWIMAPDGSARVNLTGDGGVGQDIYPEWAPDGRYIYYTSNKYGGDALELYRVNVQGRPNPQRLSNFGREVRSLSVSPENQYVALGLMTASVPLGADLKPYSADLYVLPISVVEARLSAGELVTRDDLQIIASEPPEMHIWHEQPDWQPGTSDKDSVILYVRTQNYDDDFRMIDEVWQIHMDGSENHRVMEGDSMPRWTRDGTEFVTHGFQRMEFATRSVHELPVAGLSGDAGSASLSPDKKLVIFESSDRARRPGMALVGDEETAADFVTLGDAPAYEPRWSPVKVENGN